MFALVMVVFVLWALCGIPTALIAHAKGRNVGLWAVLGSVFGLFGLTAIAAASHDTESSPWDCGSFGDFGLGDFGFGDFGGSSDSNGCGGGGCGGGD